MLFAPGFFQRWEGFHGSFFSFLAGRCCFYGCRILFGIAMENRVHGDLPIWQHTHLLSLGQWSHFCAFCHNRIHPTVNLITEALIAVPLRRSTSRLVPVGLLVIVHPVKGILVIQPHLLGFLFEPDKILFGFPIADTKVAIHVIQLGPALRLLASFGANALLLSLHIVQHGLHGGFALRTTFGMGLFNGFDSILGAFLQSGHVCHRAALARNGHLTVSGLLFFFRCLGLHFLPAHKFRLSSLGLAYFQIMLLDILHEVVITSLLQSQRMTFFGSHVRLGELGRPHLLLTTGQGQSDAIGHAHPVLQHLLTSSLQTLHPCLMLGFKIIHNRALGLDLSQSVWHFIIQSIHHLIQFLVTERLHAGHQLLLVAFGITKPLFHRCQSCLALLRGQGRAALNVAPADFIPTFTGLGPRLRRARHDDLRAFTHTRRWCLLPCLDPLTL